MSEKSVVVNKGVSFMSLLGLTFIVLKLCKVIDWSWWWVTVPFWGGAAIVIAIILLFFLFAVILSKK